MNKPDTIKEIMALGDNRSKSKLSEEKIEDLRVLLVDLQKKAQEAKAKTEEFITFCGMPFDPSHNSDCFLECKEETTEQYSRCLEHFKTAPTSAPKPKRTAKRGKNSWGHLVGSQAELIDRTLTDATGPLTIDQIAEAANARVPRTKNHIQHLQSAWSVDVRKTFKGLIFLASKFEDLAKDETVTPFK